MGGIYSRQSETKEIEETEKTKETKETEEMKKKIVKQFINNTLDNIFPTSEDINKYKRDGKTKYSIYSYYLLYGFTPKYNNNISHTSIDGMYKDTFYQVGLSKHSEDIKYTSNNYGGYYTVSLKYVINYLKNKSLPELGKPQMKKSGIFYPTYNVYYEW